MRFWPQPSQLKMPKYAAASNSGCVSFAALAVWGSAVATKEVAAACAKNWRREWSTTAGTRVLCCRAATNKRWRAATQTATRQKWRMAPMHWPLSALCTVPTQLAGLQSQPGLQAELLGTGFSQLVFFLQAKHARFAVICAQIAYTYRHTAYERLLQAYRGYHRAQAQLCRLLSKGV